MTDRRRAPLSALTTLTRRPRPEVRLVPPAPAGAEPDAGRSRVVDNAVYSAGRRVATPDSAADSRAELDLGEERLAWLGLYRPEPQELGELAELLRPQHHREHLHRLAQAHVVGEHAPEPRVLDRFAADGYDAIIAGHTHGGQVCLPGGRALTTNCDIEPVRARGLHRHPADSAPGDAGSAWLHVSAGLGTNPYVRFRVACRPEATLLYANDRLLEGIHA